MATSTRTDVLVVGAGPAGLALAVVLAEHGVDFRIVDRKSGSVRESRAVIVHVRTLELLDRLGLAERAVARGVRTTRVEVFVRGRRAGGFPLNGRGSPFPGPLGLEQDRTEQLFVDRLAELGHRVGWDTELHTLDGTTAVVRNADGEQERITARWVVGADGARSPVRHALGVGFGGKTYDQTGLLADVEMDLPAESSLPDGAIRLNLTGGGFVGMFRLSNGRYRLFGAVPPGFAAGNTDPDVSHESYAEVPLADIQAWFDGYFRVPARLTSAAWTALFRVHSRIAERFRIGSVFLVGDAAHIHSPAGGQGLNLAIGDAVNLGWKLALVAGGQAHDRLLDSYEAERQPVARTVLRGSDRGFALETTQHPVARWVREHIATRPTGISGMPDRWAASRATWIASTPAVERPFGVLLYNRRYKVHIGRRRARPHLLVADLEGGTGLPPGFVRAVMREARSEVHSGRLGFGLVLRGTWDGPAAVKHECRSLLG